MVTEVSYLQSMHGLLNVSTLGLLREVCVEMEDSFREPGSTGC